MDALLATFAHRLGLSPEDARPALDALLDALRENIDTQGAGELKGVGRFYWHEERVRFDPDPRLAAAVNVPFAGLEPIASAPKPTPATEEPSPEAEPTPGEEPIPDEGPIVNEAPALTDDDEIPEEEEVTLFSVPLESVEEGAEEAPVREPAEAPAAPVRPVASEDASEDASIAPIGGAGLAADARMQEQEETDAFAAPDEAQSPLEPALPLRDLSSEGDAGEAEDEPLDLPPAAPFAPAEDAMEHEPQAEQESPEEEGVSDEALEALLAGVWTPSNPPAAEHPLGPDSAPPIEDAEYDVVDEAPEPVPPEPVPPEPDLAEEPAPIPPEDEPESEVSATAVQDAPAPALSETVPEEGPGEEAPAAPAVALAGTPPPPIGGEAPPVASPSPASRPADRTVRERRRRPPGPAFLLPVLLLLLAVAALLLLWPWLSGEREDQRAQVPPSSPAPVASAPDTAAALPADSALAGIPGDDGAPAAVPTPDPDTPSAAAPGADLPAPLRGPDGIDPTRGGTTWVLGSGSRAHAEREVARYREQGYRADVHTSRANGRTVHRVVVGQFPSFEEALRYRTDLPPEAPSDAWVLRLE